MWSRFAARVIAPMPNFSRIFILLPPFALLSSSCLCFSLKNILTVTYLLRSSDFSGFFYALQHPVPSHLRATSKARHLMPSCIPRKVKGSINGSISHSCTRNVKDQKQSVNKSRYSPSRISAFQCTSSEIF